MLRQSARRNNAKHGSRPVWAVPVSVYGVSLAHLTASKQYKGVNAAFTPLFSIICPNKLLRQNSFCGSETVLQHHSKIDFLCVLHYNSNKPSIIGDVISSIIIHHLKCDRHVKRLPVAHIFSDKLSIIAEGTMPFDSRFHKIWCNLFHDGEGVLLP